MLGAVGWGVPGALRSPTACPLPLSCLHVLITPVLQLSLQSFHLPGVHAHSVFAPTWSPIPSLAVAPGRGSSTTYLVPPPCPLEAGTVLLIPVTTAVREVLGTE